MNDKIRVIVTIVVAILVQSQLLLNWTVNDVDDQIIALQLLGAASAEKEEKQRRNIERIEQDISNIVSGKRRGSQV